MAHGTYMLLLLSRRSAASNLQGGWHRAYGSTRVALAMIRKLGEVKTIEVPFPARSPVPCYAFPMRCPVSSYAFPTRYPVSYYAFSARYPVLTQAIVLRDVRGTDPGYRATHLLCDVRY
eukprot:1243111-Rhodomonas_salina.9